MKDDLGPSCADAILLSQVLDGGFSQPPPLLVPAKLSAMTYHSLPT